MKKTTHDIAVEAAQQLFPALARSIATMADSKNPEIINGRVMMQKTFDHAVAVIAAAIDEAQSQERAA